MIRLVRALLPLGIMLAGAAIWVFRVVQRGGWVDADILGMYGLGFVATICWAVFDLGSNKPGV